MYMKFDKKTLEADVETLKGKGVSEEMAENISQFKQAVEYAVYFVENFGFVEEEDAPKEICQSIDYANSMLENVWWDVLPIFEKSEAATVAVG